MKYEIPDYLMSIIFTSLDLRIKMRRDDIAKAPEHLRDFMKDDDDISRLIEKAISLIERQAPEGVCRRIYTVTVPK